MKLSEVIVAWNDKGEVKVGPYPDKNGWSTGFDNTWGACNQGIIDGDPDAGYEVLKRFHSMVVRDGVDPMVAHKALLEIDEYVDECAQATVIDEDGSVYRKIA